MSTERVLVQDGIADQFVEKLIEKTRTIHAGNPTFKGHALGVLESQRAVAFDIYWRMRKVKEPNLPLGIQIQDTTMQPTLVLNIQPEMLLYHIEESFGPVCTLQRFGGVEEALPLPMTVSLVYLLRV